MTKFSLRQTLVCTYNIILWSQNEKDKHRRSSCGVAAERNSIQMYIHMSAKCEKAEDPRATHRAHNERICRTSKCRWWWWLRPCKYPTALLWLRLTRSKRYGADEVQRTKIQRESEAANNNNDNNNLLPTTIIAAIGLLKGKMHAAAGQRSNAS